LHTWLERHLLSYDKAYYAHFAKTWKPALLKDLGSLSE